MCGRFNVIDNPFLQALMHSLGIDSAMPTMVNVAPTETIPIVIENDTHKRELHYMRWWLTPSWSEGPSTRYSMFNAKSETIDSSRAFRGPFRRRRGIVPVSSFIEWQADNSGKQAWLIQQTQGALALAAIWDRWEKDDVVVESCALITRAASQGFSQLHHRMPVILAVADADQWLDCQQAIDEPANFFSRQPLPPLEGSPLERPINNARNKDLSLLTPSGPAIALS